MWCLNLGISNERARYNGKLLCIIQKTISVLFFNEKKFRITSQYYNHIVPTHGGDGCSPVRVTATVHILRSI